MRAVARLFNDCRTGLNLLGPAACPEQQQQQKEQQQSRQRRRRGP